MIHPAAIPLEQLLVECKVRRGRRSGPGGQHRNKVETAVVIKHIPSGAIGEASERRSQMQNRRVALFRLRMNLAVEQRVAINPSQTPSALWKSRCNNGRILIRASHDEFPTMLAEALDVLAAHEMNVKTAAGTLACSASQLTKLLKIEPRAMRLVNDRRRQQGLRPLK